VAVVVELVYVALFEKSNVFFVTIGRSFFFGGVLGIQRWKLKLFSSFVTILITQVSRKFMTS
jgi:hypothetical protein